MLIRSLLIVLKLNNKPHYCLNLDHSPWDDLVGALGTSKEPDPSEEEARDWQSQLPRCWAVASPLPSIFIYNGAFISPNNSSREGL